MFATRQPSRPTRRGAEGFTTGVEESALDEFARSFDAFVPPRVPKSGVPPANAVVFALSMGGFNRTKESATGDRIRRFENLILNGARNVARTS